MNRSVDDVVAIVSLALKDEDDKERESVCQQFYDNKIDGKAFGAVDQLDMLFKIFPDIPKGSLLKIYQELKTSERSNSFDMDHMSNSSSSLDSSICETVTSEESSTSNHDLEVLPNLTKTVPKVFPIELCDFGFHAKELIRTGILTEKGKREVTSELIRVMKKYERYPTRPTKRSAITSFVQLGKATLGLSEEDAKKFWLRKITQKINTQLKQQRRLQHYTTPSKRTKNNTTGTASTSIIKRRKIMHVEELDVDLMNQNKQLLKEEFQKQCDIRNQRKISDMMDQTFAMRRNFFYSNPNPKSVFQEWPALSLYTELVKEFKRVQRFEKENYLQSRIFMNIINYAKQRTKSMQVKRILQKLPLNNEEQMPFDQQIIFGSWVLCNILRSNTKKEHCTERYLLDLCPENTTTDDFIKAVSDRHQPFIAVLGTTDDIKKIRLFCEKQLTLNAS